jgi:hypothetical protein
MEPRCSCAISNCVARGSVIDIKSLVVNRVSVLRMNEMHEATNLSLAVR